MKRPFDNSLLLEFHGPDIFKHQLKIHHKNVMHCTKEIHGSVLQNPRSVTMKFTMILKH